MIKPDTYKKMPMKIWRWINKRGYIPKYVQSVWPKTHWCMEWDGMLVTNGMSELSCCTCLKKDKND